MAPVEPDFEKGNGLVPVITQDAATGKVLMLAGGTSGNVQKVKEILIDCDDDTVLLKVDQIGGAACHTGYETCFYRKLDEERVEIVAEKIFDPKEVYGK